MTKTVVMRVIWFADEVDHPSQIGWYYCYLLPPHGGDDFTTEHGPFPTEEAALLDAGVLHAIASDQFTITTTPAGRTTMVAEASAVGYRAPLQIYDDAADVGIAILSQRSGKVVRFYLSSEDHDASGEDVAGWWFKMIPEDRRRLPAACREIEILIIND